VHAEVITSCDENTVVRLKLIRRKLRLGIRRAVGVLAARINERRLGSEEGRGHETDKHVSLVIKMHTG